MVSPLCKSQHSCILVPSHDVVVVFVGSFGAHMLPTLQQRSPCLFRTRLPKDTDCGLVLGSRDVEGPIIVRKVERWADGVEESIGGTVFLAFCSQLLQRDWIVNVHWGGRGGQGGGWDTLMGEMVGLEGCRMVWAWKRGLGGEEGGDEGGGGTGDKGRGV